MSKLKYIVGSLILALSFQAFSKTANKWSDVAGLKIVEKHLISKGYKWSDFKPEIITKDKYPQVYARYKETIQTFECENYFWVGLTSDKPGNPVLHAFVNKDTGSVIGLITND